MKDISEYYVGDIAQEEENAWTRAEFYTKNARFLNETVAKLENDLKRTINILECGCGSGFIPLCLEGNVEYLGIDNNRQFLTWAEEKNKAANTNARFEQADIRKVDHKFLADLKFKPDIICSFAFLKHFSLDEWDEVFSKMIRLAPVGVMEIQLSDSNFDNGMEFHHVFVTNEKLKQVVASNGRKIIREKITFDDIVTGYRCIENYIETKRMPSDRAFKV